MIGRTASSPKTHRLVRIVCRPSHYHGWAEQRHRLVYQANASTGFITFGVAKIALEKP